MKHVVVMAMLLTWTTLIHATEVRKPNILLIKGDDWSWPHAGALGGPLLSPRARATETPRPVLQIINGSRQPIDIYWLKSDRERVANGTVAPGEDCFITTTLGHRFAIVGQEDKTEVTVTSEVLVQAFRFDPPDKDGVPAFYTQRISAGGFPIVASAKVNPYALKEAAFLVDLMLAKRPDVRTAMIRSGARLCILAHNEFTTDQPEFVRLGERPPARFRGISGKDYWDARARGMGGSERDPYCSCAEENLLCYPGDPYAAECILIHEFAHNIHLRGMVNVDPTFDGRLKATYDAAMTAGLWKGKYASVNHHEYFAEGVQSWFDNNRENDHDHNHVNTRRELIEYDPGLAAICREVFGETELKYTKPATRLHGHLQGYDPSAAPTFAWPERLSKAREEILRAAKRRDRHRARQETSSTSDRQRPDIPFLLADDRSCRQLLGGLLERSLQQFSADIYGAIARGMPNVAGRMARRLGHINGYAEGSDGGVFVAGTVSLAFTERDPRRCVHKAAIRGRPGS